MFLAKGSQQLIMKLLKKQQYLKEKILEEPFLNNPLNLV